MGTQKLIGSLKGFAESISHEYPLRSMYLFGSRATGKVRKDSDVDLIMVSSKFRGKRRLQRSPPLYMMWDLDYPVDFVCLTPEEFNKRKREIGIVKEAVKNGIKIV